MAGNNPALSLTTGLESGVPSVEIVHWFLERPHEPVLVTYAASERPGLEKRLAARIEAARAGAFRVSPTPHRGLCLTCPGRGGMCSWGATETLRPDPLLGAGAPQGPLEPA